MNSYIIIVVPENKKTNANLDADKLDSGRTSKTFTVGLSSDGKFPITSRWCCWWMSDDEKKEIRKDFDPLNPVNPTNKNSSKIYDLSKGWTPDLVLADNQLKRIEIDMSKDKGI